MKNKNELEKCKNMFGEILKLVFSYYNLKDTEFGEKYDCDASTSRNWKTGRCFPSGELFEKLQDYILDKAKQCNKDETFLIDGIESICKKNAYASSYIQLRHKYTDNTEFIVNILRLCIQAGKGNLNILKETCITFASEGRTRVVVFDFDGTLTKTGINTGTTWESLWAALGYDIRECQNLHRRYDNKEITHDEWCRLTEDKFKERKLHRDTVKKIAKKIHLIKGVEEVFLQLSEKDIKIYIVSGSIKLVIQSVLGKLTQYIDGIKANQFMFDKEGYLTKIIGTKYDFEGKAEYIQKIACELSISTKDIFFVGNSRNDHYVHKSGARTFCINPRQTDMSDKTIWDNWIERCDDLREILEQI